MIIKKIISLSLLLLCCLQWVVGQEERVSKYNLPYKNTYVKEALVAENEFRSASRKTLEPRSFEEAKQILPNPIWEGHNREVEMYWKAWEIAIGNIRQPEVGSGLVSPYLDIAYNGNLFMWDACFMMMYARYGYHYFPFQNTLDNFYAKQHPDGFICREIKADGADCFERYDPTSTGPNLLPWAEMQYYKQYGDLERLHKVFPALCAYAKWWQLNRTWQNGTYWSSGYGSGMDNMPRSQEHYSRIFSHGHMVWLDANLQQILVNESLLEMGFYTEKWQEIEEFEDEARFLKKYINENLWDEKRNFLFDQHRDGQLGETMGVAAFWALKSDVLPDERLDKLVGSLRDTALFNRKHRVPSMSASSDKYHPKGRYWQGGVWPGTTYMILGGLYENGYVDLAHEIAMNHYDHVFEVYKQTGTFWEYYSPESSTPGFMARPNFVGWTGLPPIAVFIEYTLGIKSDFSKNSVVWDINNLEEHGIERYPFGKVGLIDMRVAKRAKKSAKPKVTVTTTIPFEMTLNWGEGMSKIVKVEEGTHTLQLK